MTHEMRTGVRALVVLALIAGLNGCSLYRMESMRNETARLDPGSGKYEGKVVWSLFWGLVNPPRMEAMCHDQGVAEVRIRSNLGFHLVSVATLGLVSPLNVKWKCAAPNPEGGDMSEVSIGETEKGNASQ